MSLISKQDSLSRMIDAFKTASYDNQSGNTVRYPWKEDYNGWLNQVYDLITAPSIRSQRLYSKLLMDTLSMLLAMCGLEVQSIRLAASETLNKIVKATFLTHITRIQMTAFNEMKKNGNTRSLKAALSLFSSICPHLQPLRCKPTVNSLTVVLVNIVKRNEEVLNECLSECWNAIFGAFSCHLIDKDIQVLSDVLISNLCSRSATTRRMAATGLSSLSLHGRKALVYGTWILHKTMNLLVVESGQFESSNLIGVLLAIRNLIPVFTTVEEVVTDIPLNIYVLLLSCIRNSSDHNVTSTALEAMQVLLQNVSSFRDFTYWLTTPCERGFPLKSLDEFIQVSLATELCEDTDAMKKEAVGSSPSATDCSTPEVESIHSGYFCSSHESLEVYDEEEEDFTPISESSMESVSYSVPEAEMHDIEHDIVIHEGIRLSASPEKDIGKVASPTVKSPTSPSFHSDGAISKSLSGKSVPWGMPLQLQIDKAACCITSFNQSELEDVQRVPIVHLVWLLRDSFLGDDSNARVSIQSLALQCITSSVELYPAAMLCRGIPLATDMQYIEPIKPRKSMEGDPNVIGGSMFEVIDRFSVASDPKLRGNAAILCGTFLRSVLKLSLGEYPKHFTHCSSATPETSQLVSMLIKLAADDSHLVMKAVCQGAKLCLPELLCSRYATLSLKLFTTLLQLKSSTYWLVKTELLSVLSSINYVHISGTEAAAQVSLGALESQAIDTVFALLGSEDQRVRDAAAEAVANLVPNLSLAHSKQDNVIQAALQQRRQFFSESRSSKRRRKRMPKVGRDIDPPLLQYICRRVMNIVTNAANQNQLLGSISALRYLATKCPPIFQPDAWNCNNETAIGWLSLLVPMVTSSWITHHLQGQMELIDFLMRFITGISMNNIAQSPREGQSGEFVALENARLSELINDLFCHILRVLNIFSHIIEEKEPEQKLSKSVWEIQRSGLGSSKASPISKETKGVKTFKKFQDSSRHDQVFKGLFHNHPHYTKLMEGLKSAYSNYRLSLDFEGSDKFSMLLGNSLNCLAALLEICTFQDVSKHTEEVMMYVHITFQVDPRGSILCTQQVINALFGLNAAVHKANIVSPAIYSDIGTIPPLSRSNSPVGGPSSLPHSSSLYTLCVSEPLSSLVNDILMVMPRQVANDFRRNVDIKAYGHEETDGKPKHSRKSSLSGRLTFQFLPAKPTNSVIQIQDYIKYFNQVVIVAMREFSLTSSVLFQERVLFMLHQLLLLKVKYEPLDPQGSFLNSVLKYIGSLERGRVEGGERLVPFIFQLLVLLTQDTTCRSVTLPKVLQLCDSVMASGQVADKFILPALRPLVVTLFLKTTMNFFSDKKLLNAAREVVIEKLLRLSAYHPTMEMFAAILQSDGNEELKPNLARQILAAILPLLGKLQIQLDSPDAILAFQQLLMAIGNETPEIQPIFSALATSKTLTSLKQVWRWVGAVTAVLNMVAIFANDECLKLQLEDQDWTTPSIDTPELVLAATALPGTNAVKNFVCYLLESVNIASSTLLAAMCTPGHIEEQVSLLCHILGELILLLQYFLTQGFFSSLDKMASSLVSKVEPLLATFTSLSSYQPLLSLSFFKLIASLGCKAVRTVEIPCEVTTNQQLVAMVTKVIQIDNTQLEDVEGYVKTLLGCPREPMVMEHFHLKVACNVDLCIRIVATLSSFNWTELSCTNKKDIINLLYSFECDQGLVDSVAKLLLEQYFTAYTPKSLSLQAANMLYHHLDKGTILSSDLSGNIHTALKKINMTKCRLYPRVTATDTANTAIHLSDPLGVTGSSSTSDITLEWLVAVLQQLVSSDSVLSDCIPNVQRLLLVMDEASILSILTNPELDLMVIEQCVHFVVEMARTPPPERVGQFYEAPSTPPAILPFNRVQLLTNVTKRVLFEMLHKWTEGDESIMKRSSDGSVLAHASLWLLSAPPVFPALNISERKIILSFPIKLLQRAKSSGRGCKTSILALALKHLAKVLEDSFIVSAFKEKELTDWTISLVSMVYDLVASSLLTGVQLPKVIKRDYKGKAEESDFKRQLFDANFKATSLLEAVHKGLLPSPDVSPTSDTAAVTLPSDALYYLSRTVIGMCRLPALYAYCSGPPNAYKMGWDGPDIGFIPEDLLVEREVLAQFNKQVTSLGWLSKQQFEEYWMQYLSVLNQLRLPEGKSPDAAEMTQVFCCCIRGMTSLIMMAKLAPECGNPLKSSHLRTHRQKDIPFIGSRLGKKLSYLLNLLNDTHSNTRSLVNNEISQPSNLYGVNLERYLPSGQLGPGQFSLISHWPVMLVENFVQETLKQEGSEVDPRSSLMFLIEQYNLWLSSAQSIPSLLLAELVRSVVVLSDAFSTGSHFTWMLATFLDLHGKVSSDDITSNAYLIYGILKCAAVDRMKSPISETIAKLIEEALHSEVVDIQIACLRGLLYVFEDSTSSVTPLVWTPVAAYLTKYLSPEAAGSISQYHLILTWSLAVTMSENGFQHKDGAEFINRTLHMAYEYLSDRSSYHLSDPMLKAIGEGLERLLLKCAVKNEDKKRLSSPAVKRLQEVSIGRCIVYLRILLVCMYSGEAGEGMIGIKVENEDSINLYMREIITAILERFRKSGQSQAGLIVRVLPTLLVDFFTPTDAISFVIHELLSLQQTHFTECAELLSKVFELLIALDQLPLLTEWALLSLNSFTQRSPDSLALWSILCLLLSVSGSKELRAFVPIVAGMKHDCLDQNRAWVHNVLSKCVAYFYQNQCNSDDEKQRFLLGFQGFAHHSVHRTIMSVCN